MTTNDKTHFTFTPISLQKKAKPVAGKQVSYWDFGTKGQLGLSVLVSGRTKTFRSTYYMNGKALSRKLGRYPEMSIKQAREMTVDDRGKAARGIDPNPKHHKPEAGPTVRSYEDVVDEFIEKYAKPRQRTWAQTQRVLKVNCAPWIGKPFASITKTDALTLLEDFIAAGHGPKAALTLNWTRTLWRWAWKRDYVTSPLMDQVEINFQQRVRDRVYTDKEVIGIWRAADKLKDVSERSYAKLLLLLTPRKNELAGMKWSEVYEHKDEREGWVCQVWSTPHERTKSKQMVAKKRIYLTPLPPLAVRILKRLPKRHDELVFPTLQSNTGTERVKRQLIRQGAPKDFTPHDLRRTIATWLETKGHSEYERGLVLNHSGTTVTSKYSYGYPIKLKLELLTKYADHIEALVQPKGISLLG